MKILTLLLISFLVVGCGTAYKIMDPDPQETYDEAVTMRRQGEHPAGVLGYLSNIDYFPKYKTNKMMQKKVVALRKELRAEMQSPDFSYTNYNGYRNQSSLGRTKSKSSSPSVGAARAYSDSCRHSTSLIKSRHSLENLPFDENKEYRRCMAKYGI